MTVCSDIDRRIGIRHLAVFAALAMMAALFPLAGSSEAFHAPGTPNDVSVDRMFGPDRHGTARDIADKTFNPEDVDTVLLARSDDYPDSLSGNYLAGVLGVPVILTPTADFHPDTLVALDNMSPQNVIILGGVAAVSAEVEQALRDAGYNVSREGGEHRWETASMIAETATARAGGVGTWQDQPTAIVASGQNFPDALVFGGLGYSEGFPVLLTPTDFLIGNTEDTLTDLGIERVIIAGGTGAVSTAVQTEIEALGIDVTRVAGRNRVATSVAFANFVGEQFNWTYNHVNLARGDKFPDALTVGPHFGGEDNPLLLTHNPDQIGTSGDPTEGEVGRQETEPWLREHACEILSIHIAGGTAAISDAVASQADAAASDCPNFLTLEPKFETNTVAVDAEHTVTGELVLDDAPAGEGVDVRFEVWRETDTAPTLTAETTTPTTAGGAVSFTYSGPVTPAEDLIVACVVLEGEAPVEGQPLCGTVDTDDTGEFVLTPTDDRPLDWARKSWVVGP